jgi:hypothetical protein
MHSFSKSFMVDPPSFLLPVRSRGRSPDRQVHHGPNNRLIPSGHSFRNPGISWYRFPCHPPFKKQAVRPLLFHSRTASKKPDLKMFRIKILNRLPH